MSKRHQVALFCLILIGFALRVVALDAVPLRGDEAFTVTNWARMPTSETIHQFATVDPHPPLAYALFRAWALLVDNTEPFMMRILPALLNLLGIPAVYALGHRLHNRSLGLTLALLWTFAPFQIWHAQDVRNYGIWAALSPLTLWLGLLALERSRRVDWILYIAAAIFTAYLYYLEVFIMIALNLYVLLVYWRRWSVWLRWAASQIIIGTALAPWYLQPRLRGGGGYTGTAVNFDLGVLFREFAPTLLFGRNLPAEVFAWIALPLWILVLVGLGALAWRRHRIAILGGLMVTIPLVLLGIVSTQLDVFRARYVLGSAAAYVLLIFGAAWIVPGPRHVRQGLVAGLCVVWLGISLVGLREYYTGTPKAPRWDLLNEYLRENASSDDLVIQTATADAAFGYYYDAPAREIALPNPALDRQTTIDALEEVSAQYESLWIVGQTAPGFPNAGLVEAWTGANLQRVRDTGYPGLPIRQYKPYAVSAEEITREAAIATFGEAIQLLDARVFPQEPTGHHTIWLYWRTLEQTVRPHKIFVHLRTSDSPIPVAQDDRLPLDAGLNSADWDRHLTFRDVYTIQTAGIPSGEYELVVGWYDETTGNRLWTASGDDTARIGPLMIEPAP